MLYGQEIHPGDLVGINKDTCMLYQLLPTEYDKRVELVSCPYFTTSLYDLTRQQGVDLSRLNSFVVVICLEGSGTLTSDAGSSVSIHQGETVLVPASTWSMGMIPDGRMKVLTSWIE